MLQSPKSGDNILTWAKNATKEINSNTIHNGIGIKVLRTPQGTNISVQPSAKGKGSSPSTRMPFDCSLIEQTEDSLACEVHILKGSLFYGSGHSLVEIQPTGVVANDYWDLSITVSEDLMLGIACTYDSESESTFPESFTVTSIPLDADLMTAQGLQYYPLVRFIKIGPNQEYGGPFIFSIQVPSEGSGSEGAKDTYYAIQCYHGDLVFDNNDYSPWVGEVASGSNGSYLVHGVDGSGQYVNGTVNIVEIAGCATLPYGSRIIVHRIMTESLAAGSMSSGS
jgi:hypothetical protein